MIIIRQETKNWSNEKVYFGKSLTIDFSNQKKVLSRTQEIGGWCLFGGWIFYFIFSLEKYQFMRAFCVFIYKPQFQIHYTHLVHYQRTYHLQFR